MTPYAPNLISSVRKPQAALLELWSGLSLTLARAHEACGQFRRSFAMMVAQNTQGPVFWVAPEWSTDRLHPEGVTPFFSPWRLTFVNPKRAEDILWCVEEILRSSAVPLVVADLPGLPALTPVRRLHLAAETGAREGGCAPLALLLTPGTGGAPGVESRWHMGPIPQTGMDHWQLTRIRSRSAPPRRWHVARHEGRYRLTPVAQGNLQS